MIVQARIAAGIAAAAAIGGLLTACGGQSGQPTAQQPTSSASTSGNTPATTGNTGTAQQVALHFPNKNLTISMAGYDSTVKMVQFQLAVWVAGGADDGHYADDPTDSATHRLAIAPGAKLTALSPDCTGPSAGDPNTDGSTCTVAQFAAALSDGSAIGPAKVHVNAADQIDSAQELYHP